MSRRDEPTIEERCQALRGRLRAQREVIARQLGPPEDEQAFPRSKLMKFLTRRSAVVVTTVTELVALFAGARHARAVMAALALSRIVRSAAVNGGGRTCKANPRP